jgi:hypothetical protein
MSRADPSQCSSSQDAAAIKHMLRGRAELSPAGGARVVLYISSALYSCVLGGSIRGQRHSAPIASLEDPENVPALTAGAKQEPACASFTRAHVPRSISAKLRDAMANGRARCSCQKTGAPHAFDKATSEATKRIFMQSHFRDQNQDTSVGRVHSRI